MLTADQEQVGQREGQTFKLDLSHWTEGSSSPTLSPSGTGVQEAWGAVSTVRQERAGGGMEAGRPSSGTAGQVGNSK